jgi:hypothetical protein
LAPRSPRRARSPSIPGTARRRSGRTTAEGDASAPAADFEEVAARAARLGITPERVLQEYAYIAFADLRHFVEWGQGGGFSIKSPESLSEGDAASIQEISAGSSGKGPVRVRLYDKKAALDAIARHLGMFPASPRRHEEDQPADLAEDAREVLARRLARLAAGGVEAGPRPIADSEPGGGAAS